MWEMILDFCFEPSTKGLGRLYNIISEDQQDHPILARVCKALILLFMVALIMLSILLLVKENLKSDSVLLVWAGIIGGIVFLTALVILIVRRLVRWYKKRQKAMYDPRQQK